MTNTPYLLIALDLPNKLTHLCGVGRTPEEAEEHRWHSPDPQLPETYWYLSDVGTGQFDDWLSSQGVDWEAHHQIIRLNILNAFQNWLDQGLAQLAELN